MTAQESRYQQLRQHLHYLRLETAAEALPAELERAREEKLSHTAFLERLLGIEVEATEARRLAGRLRFASLPAPWTLADFDFDAQPTLDRKLVDELATLRFVEEAANVLLVGPPGVGKTMLAICLARAAVEAGHRRLLHERLRSRRPLPPGGARGPLGDGDALLLRAGRTGR
jgi:DNA replication protein DnaC